jgi:hypothetical protein
MYLVPRAEVTLFGAGGLFVTADADDHAGEVVFVEDLLRASFLRVPQHSTRVAFRWGR